MVFSLSFFPLVTFLVATSVVHSRPQGKLKHGGRKSQKKSHSTLRAKLRLQSSLKIPKMVSFGEFLKTRACGQIVLPDRSILIKPKLADNGKNKIISLRHSR